MRDFVGMIVMLDVTLKRGLEPEIPYAFYMLIYGFGKLSLWL